LALKGAHAFVANYRDGLQVIDISDPTHPALVGSADTPGYAVNVRIAGELAYVADASGGVRIFDIGDPVRPSEIGVCDTPGQSHSLLIAGELAYVADGLAGLTICDVSDPSQPKVLSSVATPPEAPEAPTTSAYGYRKESAPRGTLNRIALHGSTLFGSAGDYGFRVFDVSDPMQPREIGSFDAGDFTTGVRVVGPHAYVAAGHEGLYVLDVSEPARPTAVARVDTPGRCGAVEFLDDLLLVLDGTGGIQVWRRGLELEVGREVAGETVTHSITVRNRGDGEIGGIFLASQVPVNAELVRALPPPPGSSYLGDSGGGPAWRVNSVPPRGSAGPFSFEVRGPEGAARAWAFWSRPAEGVASGP
jgi:hypothetical protein